MPVTDTYSVYQGKGLPQSQFLDSSYPHVSHKNIIIYRTRKNGTDGNSHPCSRPSVLTLHVIFAQGWSQTTEEKGEGARGNAVTT